MMLPAASGKSIQANVVHGFQPLGFIIGSLVVALIGRSPADFRNVAVE
jgi:hypothetical protein